MSLSRPRIVTVMTAVLAGATAATVVTAVAPSAVSAAEDLLTGGDIQNGSITRRDVQNGSITGRQIRDGSIRAVDLKAGLLGDLQGGLPGPRGPVGPQGEPGPAGVDGRQVDGVATWTVHHEADGSSSVAILSTDKVPALAVIEPLGATFTGDFTSCQGYMGPTTGSFSADGHGDLVNINAVSGKAANASASRVSLSGPASLRFAVFCYDGTIGPVPVPTFDASITFAWTVLDPTPTATFD